MIPMRDTQWVTGTATATAKNSMWFCAGCGEQYPHAIRASKDLVSGQDLVFSYIVFLQFELKGGVRALCAMAEAPDDLLQSQITTLKMIMANSRRQLHVCAQLGIMDLMTMSNDMFEMAMKDFPKVKTTIMHPHHAGLGTSIVITRDGVTSLRPDQVGTDMNFMGMDKAHKDGYFGDSPRIWGDKEWSLLLDYLCGGITHSKEEWEIMEYRAQVWDTEDQRVTKPTKARKARLRELAARAAKPDAYLKHQMSIKSFKAADALSVITESTAFNSEGEECEDSDVAFKKAEAEVWSKAAKREAKNTKAKARGSAGAARGNALGKAKRAERSAKRGSGAASSSMITT